MGCGESLAISRRGRATHDPGSRNTNHGSPVDTQREAPVTPQFIVHRKNNTSESLGGTSHVADCRVIRLSCEPADFPRELLNGVVVVEIPAKSGETVGDSPESSGGNGLECKQCVFNVHVQLLL
jgi:hypothetical protein